MADGERAIEDLTYKSVFIGSNLTGEYISKLHGDVLDIRIQALRRSLEFLTDTRQNAAFTQRLKRDSQDNSRTTKHGIPLPYFLRNESSLPDGVYLPINERGMLTRRRCVGSRTDSVDLNKVSASYRQTMQLVSRSIQGATPTSSFGFKLYKPNYGHEYHIHVLQESRTRHGAGQAYQVITWQRYNRPRVRHKQVAELRPLLVLVTLPSDTINVRDAFTRSAQAIASVKSVGGVVVVLFTNCSDMTDTELTAIFREFHSQGVVFRLAKIDRLSEVLSHYGDDWIFMRASQNVVFQAGFLLRCMLHVRSGRSAYFPIPLLRNDVPRMKEKPKLDQGLKWKVNNRDSWHTSNFESYCIGLADVRHAANAGYDITNGRDVYNASKKRLQIRRIIDGNLQQLKSPASGKGCQTDV